MIFPIRQSYVKVVVKLKPTRFSAKETSSLTNFHFLAKKKRKKENWKSVINSSTHSHSLLIHSHQPSPQKLARFPEPVTTREREKMACAASSSAILSPNPRVFAAKSHAPMAAASVSSLPKPFSQTLTLSSNFNGVRKSFQSPRRAQSSRSSFVVRASVCRFLLLILLFSIGWIFSNAIEFACIFLSIIYFEMQLILNVAPNFSNS